jgi:HIRAN domain
VSESLTFVVRLRGGSYGNEDGSQRQNFLAECKPGDALTLRAEPTNPHDRHAVAVLDTRGRQLGYLPSDARNASSIQRGEGVSASVARTIGGPRWWHRFFGLERHYGLLIRLTKASIDWAAHNKHREAAQVVDKLVAEAVRLEKSEAPIAEVIACYETALSAVVSLNESSPVIAAHRYEAAPINRLTMLLVREKRREEARRAYEGWLGVADPVGLTKVDKVALEKRMSKLS